jgi:hypothetical protein
MAPVTTPQLVLHKDGTTQLTRIDENGIHWHDCPNCGKHSNLGTSAVIYNAIKHHKSRPCLQAERALRARRAQAEHLAQAVPPVYHASSRAAQLTAQLFRDPSSSSPITPTPITPVPDTPTPDHPVFRFPPPLHVSASSTVESSSSATNTLPHVSMSEIAENVSPTTTAYQLVPCSGFKRAFPSIYRGYAFGAHDESDMDWDPVGLDKVSKQIVFRASACTGALVPAGEACTPCHYIAVSDKFCNFLDRANLEVDEHDHLPYNFLTLDQSNKLLRKIALIARHSATEVSHSPTQVYLLLNSPKLKRAKESRQRLKIKMNDMKRILHFISSRDIAGLRRLIAAALKRNASPQRILDMLQDAAAGLSRVRSGFNKRDLDLAFIVKSLGGPRLLYALSKAYGLPSERTVYRHHHASPLLVSLGAPTKEDAIANMEGFLHPDKKPSEAATPRPSGFKPGHILAFDGVAIEPKARYDTSRDCIIGISRESEDIPKQVTDISVLKFARESLFEQKTIRLGTEATVVVLAPYCDTENYTPVPIAVSPSDNTEHGTSIAEWMQALIEAIHDKGHGPVWSLASDGASSYRIAKEIICLVQCLSADNDDLMIRRLHELLSPLIGLNLYTSKEGVTSTCDPKHVLKRMHS